MTKGKVDPFIIIFARSLKEGENATILRILEAN